MNKFNKYIMNNYYKDTSIELRYKAYNKLHHLKAVIFKELKIKQILNFLNKILK